jgi:aquaporin Z
MRKYIAELIGTFALTFVVLLSLSSASFPVSTPLLAALTLTLFVYTIGNISTANINPAVTLGLLAIGKMDFKDAVFYIVCQFIGAAAAMALAQTIGISLPGGSTNADSMVLAAESFGAFFFTFGIAAVAVGRVADAATGIVVGGSLLLGIAIASLIGSAGILNPAVAFGLRSFSIPYVVGPILGSVFGMLVYRLINHQGGKKEHNK